VETFCCVTATDDSTFFFLPNAMCELLECA
jgi:hypothetical protein